MEPNATCPDCGQPVIEAPQPGGVVRLEPFHGTRQVLPHAAYCPGPRQPAAA